MKTKNLSKIFLMLLALSMVLSLFSIGDSTEPIYMYINDYKYVKVIVPILILATFCLSIVFLYLLQTKSKRLDIITFLFLSICLTGDILLGGNVLSIFINTIGIFLTLFSIFKYNKKN